MIKYKYLTAIMIACAIFISETSQAKRGRGISRTEVRSRTIDPRSTEGAAEPIRPGTRQPLDSSNRANNNPRPSSLPEIVQSRIYERWGANERTIRDIHRSLNSEDWGHFRLSIISLERYIRQNTIRQDTTRSNNSEIELAEKLQEALLLSPTHSFIRQTIRMLTVNQIASSDISSAIEVLNSAKSFISTEGSHTNAMYRALFRNWYVERRGQWRCT